MPPPPPPNLRPPQGYSPPGARRGPDGPARPGSPPASDGLATVKGFAGKMSVTAWIVLGGLVATVIAMFLPFATVSIKLFGRTLNSHGVAADGTAKLVVIVLAAVAMLLAFPALSGSQVPAGRLIGVSVVVGLLAGLTVVWFNTVAAKNSQGEGFVDVTPAFGLMVYGAAVTVTAVGVVLLWIDRSKTKQA